MTQQVRDGCIEMCKLFHTTTIELSERYYLELERHNYVTPTSYLELISTFKMLLDNKRRCAYFVVDLYMSRYTVLPHSAPAILIG